jgi:hypothetical protein
MRHDPWVCTRFHLASNSLARNQKRMTDRRLFVVLLQSTLVRLPTLEWALQLAVVAQRTTMTTSIFTRHDSGRAAAGTRADRER